MNISITSSPLERDVLVVGGGLAGLASAILLARRGWSVEVIDDPEASPSDLGESLEFSAPPLLRALGVNLEMLLAQNHGFPKKNVFIDQVSAPGFEIWPPGWFRHPPLFGSHFTLHIDRRHVDEQLRGLAVAAGVSFTDERVMSVGTAAAGRRSEVSHVVLRSGAVRKARWYVDASGHRSRLFGRALGLVARPLGDERVALYRRCVHTPTEEVTRLLFSANADDRMTWAWVLPVGSRSLAIGVVVPADELRQARSEGRTNDDVYWDFLASFPHLDLPSRCDDGGLSSRAFTPYVHDRASGPNWLLVGDSAALLDPITSSGVATALHSAHTADRLVDQSLQRRRLNTFVARAAHHHLLVRTATVVNQLVGRVLHRRGLRSLIGTRLAAFVYAITNVLISAWYSRLRPSTIPRMAAHGVLLGAAVTLSAAALAIDRARAIRLGRGSRRQPHRSRPALDRPIRSRHG